MFWIPWWQLIVILLLASAIWCPIRNHIASPGLAAFGAYIGMLMVALPTNIIIAIIFFSQSKILEGCLALLWNLVSTLIAFAYPPSRSSALQEKLWSRVQEGPDNPFLAMIEYEERSLPMAADQKEISPETLEYCQGIIDLTIQGKRVAKTRKQWADYLMGGRTREGSAPLRLGFPFRSYDSDRTKAKRLRRALLQLESFNKAHPEATLDEMIEKINSDCRGRISIRRLANHRRRGLSRSR